MAEYQLYCFAQSGNAYRVALMLNLIGADWKPTYVDFFGGETRTPKYRTEINEMGEVPVLVHGAKKLSQSGVCLVSTSVGAVSWLLCLLCGFRLHIPLFMQSRTSTWLQTAHALCVSIPKTENSMSSKCDRRTGLCRKVMISRYAQYLEPTRLDMLCGRSLEVCFCVNRISAAKI